MVESLPTVIDDDALDDGFPYEHIGNEIELAWSHAGWITPTPFMVASLKEMLGLIRQIYGRNGHPLLREIGPDFSFVDKMGLASFCRLEGWAEKCLDEHIAIAPDR